MTTVVRMLKQAIALNLALALNDALNTFVETDDTQCAVQLLDKLISLATEAKDALQKGKIML